MRHIWDGTINQLCQCFIYPTLSEFWSSASERFNRTESCKKNWVWIKSHIISLWRLLTQQCVCVFSCQKRSVEFLQWILVKWHQSNQGRQQVLSNVRTVHTFNYRISHSYLCYPVLHLQFIPCLVLICSKETEHYSNLFQTNILS